MPKTNLAPQPALDVNKIRKDFPILGRQVYDKPLVYFDNAATTQKPQSVLNITNKMLTEYNSNVHRGVHYLSAQMTDFYEQARERVRGYLNAKSTHEIIFTAGVTASINTVAYSFGLTFLKPGDEIIVSEMEHHSNIVPWQLVAEQKGASLKVIPFNEQGELLMEEYKKLFNEKTKFVAVVHVSNSLGTVNPVKEMVIIAHEHNVPILIDGAQGLQHGSIDVQDLDCDFYAFSGHKVYGPTGIGVLYGKEKWLEKLPPFLGGGDMIDKVSFEKTTYADLPFKFEAGTPNYIGAVGLGEAMEYLKSVGLDKIQTYEKQLLDYATAEFAKLDGVKVYGQAKNKIAIMSFLLNRVHSYDTGMLLDKMGIAVRVGHHCTQPIWKHYQTTGSARASLVFYNTFAEIDALVEAIKKIQQTFA